MSGSPFKNAETVETVETVGNVETVGKLGTHHLSTAECARLGVRLRWRLVRNTLARKGMTLFVLTMVAASLAALFGLATFGLARTYDPIPQRALIVVVMTMIVVGWTFAPLLAGGTDETVDPTRLVLLPLTTRQLTAILAGGAASSPAVCAVGIALIGVVIGYAPANFGAVIVVADAIGLFVLGLGIARTVAAGLARAQRSRKGRDVAVLASALAAVTVWLATQAIGPILEVAHRNRSMRIVDVLSWLPPGWLARSVLDAGAGRWGPSIGFCIAGLVAASAMLLLWGRMTQRMMQQSERIVASGSPGGTAAPLGTAASPFGAAVAKEVRYLRRSPLRRTQLLIFTVMGTALTVFQAVRLHGSALPFMALIATVFGVGPAMNIIGFDSPSLWLEVVVGGPDRTMLRARSLGYLPQLAVPTIVAAVVLGVWKGNWPSVIAVVMLAPSVALIAVGLGAWVSPRVPIPQRDGDNAFAWRNASTGKGCIVGVYVFCSLIVVGILAAPIILPTLAWRERSWVFAIPVVGAAGALAVWFVGTSLGGRSIRHKGPELLSELSNKAIS